MFLKTLFALCAVFVALGDCSNVPGGKEVGEDYEDAKVGEVPSFVAIVNKETGEMITGGVLLQSQVVLTLGSSYVGVNPEDLCVVLGVMNKTMGVVAGQTMNVSEIAVHPGVSSSTPDPIEGDIALMKLEQPVERGRYVQPYGIENIKGRSNRVRSKRATRKLKSKCLLYGFLRTGNYAVVNTQVLQRFRPHIKPSESCQFYASQRDFPWNKRAWYCSLDDGFANTCSGNGGEPVFCGNRNRGFELQGLVPRRLPDYCYSRFAVYTRLAGFYTWITETVVGMGES